VHLGGADEHVVEHSPAGEQILSETIVVRAGAGQSATWPLRWRISRDSGTGPGVQHR
jgi:hypothetical protein